jgi:hypothetical protein
MKFARGRGADPNRRTSGLVPEVLHPSPAQHQPGSPLTSHSCRAATPPRQSLVSGGTSLPPCRSPRDLTPPFHLHDTRIDADPTPTSPPQVYSTDTRSHRFTPGKRCSRAHSTRLDTRHPADTPALTPLSTESECPSNGARALFQTGRRPKPPPTQARYRPLESGRVPSSRPLSSLRSPPTASLARGPQHHGSTPYRDFLHHTCSLPGILGVCPLQWRPERARNSSSTALRGARRLSNRYDTGSRTFGSTCCVRAAQPESAPFDATLADTRIPPVPVHKARHRLCVRPVTTQECQFGR